MNPPQIKLKIKKLDNHIRSRRQRAQHELHKIKTRKERERKDEPWRRSRREAVVWIESKKISDIDLVDLVHLRVHVFPTERRRE